MNPPIFPEEILASMPTEPAVSSPVAQPDVELDSEPVRSPQHAKKGKSKGASSSKKGKENMHAVEPEDDSDFEVTPLPPLPIRGRQ